MALRGKRIKYFFELWWMVGSGGFTINVSSSSFYKNSIGWPQQPPTEKVLKFNWIFRDSIKNFFFSKHPNKAEFNDMDDETQMVKHLEPTIHHNSKKYLILLPLRVIYFRSFHYETPCKYVALYRELQLPIRVYIFQND